MSAYPSSHYVYSHVPGNGLCALVDGDVATAPLPAGPNSITPSLSSGYAGAQAMTAPTRTPFELSLTDDAATIGRRVPDLTNGPATRTLVDIFSSSVARWPDQVALDAGVGRLTFRQLADEAQQLAGRLATVGAGHGDRVGIRVPSGTAELYIAVLGTLLAGAAYVPVDFADPEARAEFIWRESDVTAIVGKGLTITGLREGQGTGGRPSPADDCWVIFTSGSTGAPKGVVVSHGAAAAFVDAETSLWDVHCHDRVLAGLSVGFDASCEEMWLAWRNGAALVPCPRSVVQSGVDLGPWLAARAITVVSTVPTLAAMWDPEVLTNVRLLILGGEACPPELGWRLARGREVWNTYGPTEATVVSTAARIYSGRPVTIGRPLPGWEVAVVDDNGYPVAPGQAGELVIAGAGLGRYLDPSWTPRAMPACPPWGGDAPIAPGTWCGRGGTAWSSWAGVTTRSRSVAGASSSSRSMPSSGPRRASGPRPPPSGKRPRTTRSSSVTS